MTAGWDAALSWLRIQIDAEAAIAAAAGGDTWKASDSGIYPEDARRHPGPFAVGPFGHLGEEHAAHIERQSPAVVLARIEVDRRLLDPMEWPGSGPDHEDSYRFAVQLLAQRYVHLPDFPEVLRLDQTEAR